MTTLIDQIIPFVELFEQTCTVQLPAISQKLIDGGLNPTVVGVEGAFSFLPGYRDWDPTRPVYIEPAFDCVIASLGEMSAPELFDAVRILTHFNANAAVVLTFPKVDEKAVLNAFSGYNVSARDVLYDGQSVASNWEL